MAVEKGAVRAAATGVAMEAAMEAVGSGRVLEWTREHPVCVSCPCPRVLVGV